MTNGNLDFDQPDFLVLGRDVEKPAISARQTQPLGPTCRPPAVNSDYGALLMATECISFFCFLAIVGILTRSDPSRVDDEILPITRLFAQNVLICVGFLLSSKPWSIERSG
jgi:hypothetical protein